MGHLLWAYHWTFRLVNLKFSLAARLQSHGTRNFIIENMRWVDIYRWGQKWNNGAVLCSNIILQHVFYDYTSLSLSSTLPSCSLVLPSSSAAAFIIISEFRFPHHIPMAEKIMQNCVAHKHWELRSSEGWNISSSEEYKTCPTCLAILSMIVLRFAVSNDCVSKSVRSLACWIFVLAEYLRPSW